MSEFNIFFILFLFVKIANLTSVCESQAEKKDKHEGRKIKSTNGREKENKVKKKSTTKNWVKIPKRKLCALIAIANRTPHH